MVRNSISERQPSDRMLKVGEVAYRLYVHPNTVRKWNNKGILVAYRLGPRHDRRFRLEDIDDFINQNGYR